MAGKNKISQNIPGIQAKMSTLQTKADEFVENSAFNNNANGVIGTEAVCKGRAYTAICENDTLTFNTLQSWQTLANNLVNFLNADIEVFTQADSQ